MVPDHQLSLAIGKEGQNARLAARLSGYRIDIRSETEQAGRPRGRRGSPRLLLPRRSVLKASRHRRRPPRRLPKRPPRPLRRPQRRPAEVAAEEVPVEDAAEEAAVEETEEEAPAEEAPEEIETPAEEASCRRTRPRIRQTTTTKRTPGPRGRISAFGLRSDDARIRIGPGTGPRIQGCAGAGRRAGPRGEDCFVRPR